MSGDSQKRQELLKQIANRGQVANIGYLERVKDYLFSPKRFDIVDKTTTLTAQVETQRFVICFDYLNDSICLFDHFDPTKSRALVMLFKQVTECEVNSLMSSGIVRDTISNSPPYTSLFNRLTPDVTTLLETELPNGGRVFFFTTGRKFNIVSIESKHRDSH